MAIDSDNPVSLPTPPPPRPAARTEAIAAAMRKFDGEEAALPSRPPKRFGRGGLDRRAIGALATAAIVAVVSVPVAVITLRDMPQPVARIPQTTDVEQPAPMAPDVDALDQNASAAAPTEAAEVSAETPDPTTPPATRQAETRNQLALTDSEQKTAAEAVAPLAASAPPPPAPPPPPPPPPPPAPQRSEDFAADSANAQEMIVTGSRVRRDPIAKAAPVAVVDTYGDFLSKLQAGLRADNRRAVSGLVSFPLTVRKDGRTETYRSRRDVERDFDEIFTPRVKDDILSQRPYSLSTRDDGRTRGSSRLWFAPTCFNAECSPSGPVRIREVNP